MRFTTYGSDALSSDWPTISPVAGSCVTRRRPSVGRLASRSNSPSPSNSTSYPPGRRSIPAGSALSPCFDSTFHNDGSSEPSRQIACPPAPSRAPARIWFHAVAASRYHVRWSLESASVHER